MCLDLHLREHQPGAYAPALACSAAFSANSATTAVNALNREGL
ncbi:hypothetical protein [Embleya sp. NBC_00896]|nr:hypothetical protein OG928_18170 [Embleya sp. NBC_00896]